MSEKTRAEVGDVVSVRFLYQPQMVGTVLHTPQDVGDSWVIDKHDYSTNRRTGKIVHFMVFETVEVQGES